MPLKVVCPLPRFTGLLGTPEQRTAWTDRAPLDRRTGFPVKRETQGAGEDAVNHAEAAALAEQIERMLTDPAYHGRSIGVIALHSKAQVVELEAQVRRRIRTEDFKRLQIRVGEPPAFQGDQHSVVLLSITYAEADKEVRAACRHRQRYNVAVSRAKDQL